MNTAQIWQTESDSSEATEKLASAIGHNCNGGEVLSLVSDLGGGKTTFVRGLARGIGSKDHVSSPTFKISNIYKGKDLTLYHYDFYRLRDDELISYELADALADPKSVIAIEWGSQVPKAIPGRSTSIIIKNKGESSREITIKNAPAKLLKGLT